MTALTPEEFDHSVRAVFDDRWAGSVDGPFPEELTRIVAAAYATLAERSGVETPSVAVRSSAVDEGGPEPSRYRQKNHR